MVVMDRGCNWQLVAWAFNVILLLPSYFDLSEIIVFAGYLPVTPALPVRERTSMTPSRGATHWSGEI